MGCVWTRSSCPHSTVKSIAQRSIRGFSSSHDDSDCLPGLFPEEEKAHVRPRGKGLRSLRRRTPALSPHRLIRRTYIVKCVEEIRKMEMCCIPPLRHLYNLSRCYVRGGRPSKQSKTALKDLCRTHDLIELLVRSLVSSHQMSFEAATASGEELGPEIRPEGRYRYHEYVESHLRLLELLLKETDLLLSLDRALELWDCLVEGDTASRFDRELFLDWLMGCCDDLSVVTQLNIFEKKLLPLSSPNVITLPNFLTTAKAFFIQVNLNQNNVKTDRVKDFIVEKLSLTGTEIFWRLVTESPAEDIARRAIDTLLQLNHGNLSPTLKGDPAKIHGRFLEECCGRLQVILKKLEEECLAHRRMVSTPSPPPASSRSNGKTETGVASNSAEIDPRYATAIDRLLLLLETYIRTVEAEEVSWGGSSVGSGSYLGSPSSGKTNASPTMLGGRAALGEIPKRSPLLPNPSSEQVVPVMDYPSTSSPPSLPLPHCHSAGFIGLRFVIGVVVYGSPATNSNSVPLGVPGGGNAGPVVQGPSLPPGTGSSNSGGGGDRQSDVKIATHSNEPLCTFRARLAAMLNVSSLHNMKLMRRSQNYPDEDPSPVSIQNTPGHTLMDQLLEEYGFDEVALQDLPVVMSVVLPGNHNADSSVFAVPEPPSTPGAGGRGGPSTSGGGGVASSNRFSHAESLPSAIMGSNSKVFAMLQRIANLDETRVLTGIRRLLRLLPTDPEVSDALDAISAAPSASADANPKLSPRISPRPKMSAEEKEKRQRMLREFLKPDQPPFSLLYRLETLWGRLLPPANVYSVPSASGSALFSMSSNSSVENSFREDFIASGCLTVVLDLFEKNSAVIQKAIASSISSQRPMSPTSVSVIEEQHPCFMTAAELSQRCLLIGLEIIRSIISSQPPVSWMSPPGTQVASSPSPVRPTPAKVSAMEGASGSPKKPPLQPSNIYSLPGPKQSALLQSLARLIFFCCGASRDNSAPSVAPGAGSPTPGIFGGRGSRQSSEGSTGSEGASIHSSPSSNGPQKLSPVPFQETLITRTALEVLVLTIYERPTLLCESGCAICSLHQTDFYALPDVERLILDVVLRSPSVHIRGAAAREFFALSNIPPPRRLLCPDKAVTPPRQFILQVLVNSPLALWVPMSSVRGKGHQWVAQCADFFDLRCQLLRGLSLALQESWKFPARKMLNDELDWLKNFTPTETQRDTDNILLAGHLRLIRALLTCEGVDKKSAGHRIIRPLLDRFLFPASNCILEGLSSTAGRNLPFRPPCSSKKSRAAAYDVLRELLKGCHENLAVIVDRVVTLHHQANTGLSKEFQLLKGCHENLAVIVDRVVTLHHQANTGLSKEFQTGTTTFVSILDNLIRKYNLSKAITVPSILQTFSGMQPFRRCMVQDLTNDNEHVNVIYDHAFLNQKELDSVVGADPQAKFFGVDLDRKGEKLQKSLSSLDSYFDLVMIMERYDESLILAKDILCLDWDDILYTKLNVVGESVRPKLSQQELKKVRSWQWLDVQIYEYFAAKFQQRVEQYGVQRMEDDLRYFREKLKDMPSIDALTGNRLLLESVTTIRQQNELRLQKSKIEERRKRSTSYFTLIVIAFSFVVLLANAVHPTVIK
ncbi:unnamed protein product, partial [Cyprideis torosa]